MELYSKRIQEDIGEFNDIISGRKRRELRRHIRNGTIFRRRGKDGKIGITIPKIDIPHIVFGESNDGIGRGKGKPGDVIGRDKGGDKDSGATNDPGEGIVINVDQEEILELLKEELELPDLKPKPSQVMQEERIKYNNLSRVGPDSLRHMRKTFQQTLKRCCAAGMANEFKILPGFKDPVRVIMPISSDERFRQYKIIQEPSSNAVIFFARDWSGSMDQYKCDIVSDMAWWIDLFIAKHYKRVERVYIGHDTNALEVDQKKFYRYRYGGGTNCSSAFQLVSKQFESRFPPNAWNIYMLYFTDGDNYDGDNENLVRIIQRDFGPNVVNLIGITQVMAWRYENTVKHRIDEELANGKLSSDIIKTTSIGDTSSKEFGWSRSTTLQDEDRDRQIKKAIKEILGNKTVKG